MANGSQGGVAAWIMASSFRSWLASFAVAAIIGVLGSMFGIYYAFAWFEDRMRNIIKEQNVPMLHTLATVEQQQKDAKDQLDRVRHNDLREIRDRIIWLGSIHGRRDWTDNLLDRDVEYAYFEDMREISNLLAKQMKEWPHASVFIVTSYGNAVIEIGPGESSFLAATYRLKDENWFISESIKIHHDSKSISDDIMNVLENGNLTDQSFSEHMVLASVPTLDDSILSIAVPLDSTLSDEAKLD